MQLPETNIVSVCCNLIEKFIKLFQGSFFNYVDQILPTTYFMLKLLLMGKSAYRRHFQYHTS